MTKKPNFRSAAVIMVKDQQTRVPNGGRAASTLAARAVAEILTAILLPKP
ncbi:MAG: hypothetical protein R3D67_15945 [Hyphomicrobiaceae bacterium]